MKKHNRRLEVKNNILIQFSLLQDIILGDAIILPGSGDDQPAIDDPVWYPVWYPSAPDDDPNIIIVWGPTGEVDILMAYIDNDPCVGCIGGGQVLWDKSEHQNSKFYSEGELSSGSLSAIIDDGWCICFDSLPDGRLVAVNGYNIYLETDYRSGVFDIAATITEKPDPAFLKVSPGGVKIALGLGYECPVVVFNVSLLNIDVPPQLFANNEGSYTPIEGVTIIDIAHYYAEWLDDCYLLVNSGAWPGPPYISDVGWVNTDTVTSGCLIANIPGASGGICLDNYGNLVVGLGYSDTESDVGIMRIFAADDIQTAISGGSAIDFSTGGLLCSSLSAGHMVIDHDDNLFVGGGDYVWGDIDAMGYIEKISLVYGEIPEPGQPVDVAIGERERIIIDVCQDDTAAGSLCKIPKI